MFVWIDNISRNWIRTVILVYVCLEYYLVIFRCSRSLIQAQVVSVITIEAQKAIKYHFDCKTDLKKLAVTQNDFFGNVRKLRWFPRLAVTLGMDSYSSKYFCNTWPLHRHFLRGTKRNIVLAERTLLNTLKSSAARWLKYVGFSTKRFKRCSQKGKCTNSTVISFFRYIKLRTLQIVRCAPSFVWYPIVSGAWMQARNEKTTYLRW